MSILDTVLRRREPPAKYRTIDGGHPAPYPDMTDEQLYNYETTFNVPKRTFDKPPGHVDRTGRTEPQLRDSGSKANVPPTAAMRTGGSRTAGTRGGAARATTTLRPTQSRPGTPRGPELPSQEDIPATRTAYAPVVPEPPDTAAAPLDLSKPVRTITTKQPVEIVSTRARHPVFKVLGYIGNDQVVTMFTLDGQISENGPRFLENVPQTQTLYLNIYPNREMGGRERFLLTQHETREAADAAATVERLACVPVQFDV